MLLFTNTMVLFVPSEVYMSKDSLMTICSVKDHRSANQNGSVTLRWLDWRENERVKSSQDDVISAAGALTGNSFVPPQAKNGGNKQLTTFSFFLLSLVTGLLFHSYRYLHAIDRNGSSSEEGSGEFLHFHQVLPRVSKPIPGPVARLCWTHRF
jgi:hypothetical protein